MLRSCDAIVELSYYYNMYTNITIQELRSEKTSFNQFHYCAMVNSPVMFPNEPIIKLETHSGDVCGYIKVNDGKVIATQKAPTSTEMRIGTQLLQKLGENVVDEHNLHDRIILEVTENFEKKQQLIEDIRTFSKNPKNLDNFTIKRLINGINTCYGYDSLAGGLKIYNMKNDVIQFDNFNTYQLVRSSDGENIMVFPVKENFELHTTSTVVYSILDNAGDEDFPAVLELYIEDPEGTRMIKRYRLW